MKKLAVGTFLALALTPMVTHAESRKSFSPYDQRIKYVVYNAMDTVELDGVAGVVTHIIVDPDETYVTHAFGEEGGWTFSHKGNHYFLRPKAAQSDTDLVIVTDKRTYNILLHYIGGPPLLGPDGKQVLSPRGEKVEVFAPTPWALKQATVQLGYRYPDEETKKKKKVQDKKRVERELDIDPYGAGPKNFAYFKSLGSQTITPRNVWDDYHFTYFTFPENAELPTLFVIDSNGHEAQVNTRVTGANHNIIVAQMTAREWRIRYGQRVVGVLNRAFNPNEGAQPNGTTSPFVRRVPIEGDE